MANEFELSPKELKKQADALLAAADAAEKAAEPEKAPAGETPPGKRVRRRFRRPPPS